MEGLKVHVPEYAQDLGVVFRHLRYNGADLEVEVRGSGPQGRIFVNDREWGARQLIPASVWAGGKVRIVIQRRL
jgi:hypothetical protein